MTFSAFFGRFGRTSQGTGRQRRRTAQLRMETLEDRCLPSITVTTVQDTGAGSLRAAIIAANSSPGSTIDFSLGQGVHVITLQSPLPDVTANGVTIDGGTVSGQTIELNGMSAGNTAGLALLGNNCTVTGLIITQFASVGVLVEGTGATISGSAVVGNGIGVYAFQTVGLTLDASFIEDNSEDGVQVFASAGITLENDHLEGNTWDGIRILGEMTNSGQSFGTKIVGSEIDGNLENGVHLVDSSHNIIGMPGDVGVNFIGTDPQADPDEGNGGDGVLIESSAASPATNNSITNNYIAGNARNGVSLTGAGTSNTTLVNNYIGLGLQPMLEGSPVLFTLPNNLDGVVISAGANNNRVGGSGLFLDRKTDNGAGNMISGNLGAGVRLIGTGTTLNRVQGNLIGTDEFGEAAISNSGGVVIAGGASNNLIGGTGKTAVTFGQGNLISGNQQDGVHLHGGGTNGNEILGNFIGTDVSGSKLLPNSSNGVVLTLGAAGNIVGAGSRGEGNLISGNANSGVVISQLASANVVQHNEIGTKTTGLAALANGSDGVDLLSSDNTVADNLISGNMAHGLVLEGSHNVIRGNKIGTNVTGTAAVANHHDGVFINVLTGAGVNTVGGTAAGAGNLISGNGWNGIEITGPASAANRIEGNHIGTNAAGQKALANTRDGILVKDTPGYTIGGQVSLASNLISGNGQDGVEITGHGSSSLVLLGNRIGTNVTGMVAVPNLGNGVHIDNGASNNVLGGTGAAAGNLISGNGGDGVLIAFSRSTGNRLLGNRIGTDVTGTSALANQGQGVQILQASANTVGGVVAGAGNLISGNKHDGVQVGLGAGTNLVAGNLIGTDVNGSNALSNGGSGVDLLQGAGENIIGGIPTIATTAGNVISGNRGSGVMIAEPTTILNLVEGNFIGTSQSGASALGNLGDGVYVLNGASRNQVGGSGGVGPGGAGNLISGNGGDGVRITGMPTNENVVQGDMIGTNVTGQVALGNGRHGVFVAQGAQHNSIGGLAPATGNVIAYNTKAGVAVGAVIMDSSTLYNPILSNSIYGNLGLGIDLGDDGVTPNTPNSPHVGPNQFQNAPMIDSAVALGSSTLITVSLNSIPLTPFTIQIFANAAPDITGYGQGKTLVATATLNTDTAGNGSIMVNVPQLLAGQYLAATATDPMNDTSEFGRDVRVASGIGQAPSEGGSRSSQTVNVDQAAEMIASAEGQRVGARVDVGLPNGVGSVQEQARHLADSVFGTLQTERDGVSAPATQQHGTQSLNLPGQGATDAGSGEGLDSGLDAVWTDLARLTRGS